MVLVADPSDTNLQGVVLNTDVYVEWSMAKEGVTTASVSAVENLEIQVCGCGCGCGCVGSGERERERKGPR